MKLFDWRKKRLIRRWNEEKHFSSGEGGGGAFSSM
jgi:hypothetical protein